jgi:hypothetical protein
MHETLAHRDVFAFRGFQVNEEGGGSARISPNVTQLPQSWTPALDSENNRKINRLKTHYDNAPRRLAGGFPPLRLNWVGRHRAVYGGTGCHYRGRGAGTENHSARRPIRGFDGETMPIKCRPQKWLYAPLAALPFLAAGC